MARHRPPHRSYVPGTSYTFLSAEQGVSGAFSHIVSDFAFLTPTLTYGPNDVSLELVLAPDAFASGAVTANQRAVGRSLDAIAATGHIDGIVSTLAGLGTAQGAPALDAVSGQAYADMGTLNLRSGQLFMHAIGRQTALGRDVAYGGTVAVPDTGSAIVNACAEPCGPVPPESFRTWVSPLGAVGDVSGNGNAARMDYTLGGLAMGVDRKLSPDFLLGLSAGYIYGSQSVDGFPGSGRADNYSLALYGSYTHEQFYADAAIAYSYADQRMERSVWVGGALQGKTKGTPHANQFMGQVEVGHAFDLGVPGGATLSPFANMNVAHVEQSSFTETGYDVFRLNVMKQDLTSVSTMLGVDIGGSFDIGGANPLDLKLRLGWLHDFGDMERPITASFVGWDMVPGGSFTVYVSIGTEH